MLDPGLPVALRRYLALLTVAENPGSAPRELITAVTTGVCVVGRGWRSVECIYVTRECGARPRMTAQVERVLVSLCLVLVLEAILAICALVLLLRLVSTRDVLVRNVVENKNLELTLMPPPCQTFWASSDSSRIHIRSGPSRCHSLAGWWGDPETYEQR